MCANQRGKWNWKISGCDCVMIAGAETRGGGRGRGQWVNGHCNKYLIMPQPTLATKPVLCAVRRRCNRDCIVCDIYGVFMNIMYRDGYIIVYQFFKNRRMMWVKNWMDYYQLCPCKTCGVNVTTSCWVGQCQVDEQWLQTLGSRPGESWTTHAIYSRTRHQWGRRNCHF